jgi:predicted RNA-binding protein with PUA-like domain
MAYWLIKCEPSDYSWEKLAAEGQTSWTGIRNYQARNHLREMRPDDSVFFYHAGEERMIVGLARILGAPYPDQTATTGDWSAIDLVPHKPLARVVSLEEIRNTYGLAVMPVASQSRLSVHPVTEAQAQMLLKIAKTEI